MLAARSDFFHALFNSGIPTSTAPDTHTSALKSLTLGFISEEDGPGLCSKKDLDNAANTAAKPDIVASFQALLTFMYTAGTSHITAAHAMDILALVQDPATSDGIALNGSTTGYLQLHDGRTLSNHCTDLLQSFTDENCISSLKRAHNLGNMVVKRRAMAHLLFSTHATCFVSLPSPSASSADVQDSVRPELFLLPPALLAEILGYIVHRRTTPQALHVDQTLLSPKSLGDKNETFPVCDVPADRVLRVTVAYGSDGDNDQFFGLVPQAKLTACYTITRANGWALKHASKPWCKGGEVASGQTATLKGGTWTLEVTPAGNGAALTARFFASASDLEARRVHTEFADLPASTPLQVGVGLYSNTATVISAYTTSADSCELALRWLSS